MSVPPFLLKQADPTMKKMREWLSGVLAKWTLYTNPNYDQDWKRRHGPDGFMIVPRSWVPQEKIEAEREWQTRRV